VAGAVAAATALITFTGCDLLPARSEGEKLWRARCAECHGLDGSGNTAGYMSDGAADLLDDHWENGDGPGAWEVVIRSGVFARMPANPDLTREQVKALVAYLRELRQARPGGEEP
jgi:mono/diheme cytochrome c family protein